MKTPINLDITVEVQHSKEMLKILL